MINLLSFVRVCVCVYGPLCPEIVPLWVKRLENMSIQGTIVRKKEGTIQDREKLDIFERPKMAELKKALLVA